MKVGNCVSFWCFDCLVVLTSATTLPTQWKWCNPKPNVKPHTNTHQFLSSQWVLSFEGLDSNVAIYIMFFELLHFTGFGWIIIVDKVIEVSGAFKGLEDIEPLNVVDWFCIKFLFCGIWVAAFQAYWIDFFSRIV